LPVLRLFLKIKESGLALINLDTLIAVFFSLFPLLTRKFNSHTLLSLLFFGIALAITGNIFAIKYPWSNFSVILISVSGGVLIGRALSSGRKIYIFLAVFSLLDIIQILLTQNSSPGNGMENISLYGNLIVRQPFNYKLGIFDLLILCSNSEWIRLNGGKWFISVFSGVSGMLSADLFASVTGAKGLPLIPFLTLGFLFSLIVQKTKKVEHLKSLQV
jgi:hypothetical protein